MDRNKLLVCKGICKRFGSTIALQNVDLELPAGTFAA